MLLYNLVDNTQMPVGYSSFFKIRQVHKYPFFNLLKVLKFSSYYWWISAVAIYYTFALLFVVLLLSIICLLLEVANQVVSLEQCVHLSVDVLAA